MAKKKRIKEDAFAWVQDTSEKDVATSSGKATTAAAQSSTDEIPIKKAEPFYVKYLAVDGSIVATQKRPKWESSSDSAYPWSQLGKGESAARFELDDNPTMFVVHTTKKVVKNEDETIELKDKDTENQ